MHWPNFCACKRVNILKMHVCDCLIKPKAEAETLSAAHVLTSARRSLNVLMCDLPVSDWSIQDWSTTGYVSFSSCPSFKTKSAVRLHIQFIPWLQATQFPCQLYPLNHQMLLDMGIPHFRQKLQIKMQLSASGVHPYQNLCQQPRSKQYAFVCTNLKS